MSADSRQESYFLGIQALRAVAVVLVVVTHAGYAAHESFGMAYGRVPFGSLGNLGVVLFFAISGFVIALNRSKPVGEFVFRRFCRIYPSYWLAMIIAAIALSLLGQHVSAGPQSILLYPSPLADFSLMIPYWTLVFEVLFYALASVAFALRLNDWTLTTICALWIIAVNIASYDAPVNIQAYAFPGIWILLSPAVQIFPAGFICGMHFQRLRSLGTPVALATAALALAISFYLPLLSTTQTLVRGVGVSFAILAIADLNVRSRLLLLLGTASYGIYLIHFPAITILAKSGLPLGSVAFLYLLLTGLICGGLFGLIDHRFYRTLIALPLRSPSVALR